MGKKGWLTIRNVPVNHKKSTGNPYHNFLVDFFKQNRVCPSCRGLGFKYPTKADNQEILDETTVKYSGIKDLENLHPEARLTDLVRDILEMELMNKRYCKTCNGRKFVSTEQYNRVKRRRKGRKRGKREKKEASKKKA